MTETKDPLAEVTPIKAFAETYDPATPPTRAEIAKWVGEQDAEIIANEGVPLATAYLIVALRALGAAGDVLRGEGRGAILACSTVLNALFRDTLRSDESLHAPVFKVD